MADARYVFNDCVPEGNIDLANVRPGEILSRAWSFRVNRSPSITTTNMLNNGDWGDPRKVARGYDGRLRDGNGTLLASVNTWNAVINVRTVDHQPAGYKTDRKSVV